MTEETTIIQKPGVTTGTGQGDSTIIGVSVRGILALMLTGTVCGVVATNIVLACLGYTSTMVVVPEPLYSGFMTSLGFYLGTKITKP